MITLDFETRSAADLLKWGATRYSYDVSTQVLCLCWSFDQEDEVHLWHRSHPWIAKSKRPDELIERIRSGELVEAHNARFEYVIWQNTLRREFPEFDVDIDIEQLHCSAAKASCVSAPRGLGDAAEAFGLEQRKDADGRRLIQKLSKPLPRLGKKAHETTEKLKTAIFKTLALEWEPGKQFTHSYVYRIADELAPSYTKTSSPYESIRNGLQRWEKKGFIRSVYDGVSEFTDISPPRDELLAAELIKEAPPVRWCEEEIEHRRNWAYCQQDVRSERALSNFVPEMTSRERDYWLMDFRMNERGVTLDKQAAEVGLALARQEADRLNAELFEVTRGAVDKFSRRKPLLAWINGRLRECGGEELPNTKADTFSFALFGVPTKAADAARDANKARMEAHWDSLGPEAGEVKRVLEIAMEGNKSSVAKYVRMLQSVCPDGKLHDIMLYNGADRTGRWSGKGVQPHNFVRGYSKEMPEAWDDILGLDPEEVTLIWGEITPALAKACRGALIASPGKHLYAADFNAIEARKLAWMSNCTRLLALFNTKGGDPYLDMAGAIYKREVTKADKTERNLGKKAILGLGYAMGWEKFQMTVWMDEGIWLEDEFCQEIVRIYRKEMYPEIPMLWKSSENAAIDAVLSGGSYYTGGDELGMGGVEYFVRDRFLHCRLPSGRLLAYLDPKVSTRVNYRFPALNARGKPTHVTFPAKKTVNQARVRYHAEKMAEKQGKRLTGDAPESFLKKHLSFMGRDTYTKLWKRCGTHGGTLVENYDQASSRDLLAESMYRVDQIDDFDLLLSIHDEVIAEAPIGAYEVEEFEHIMAEVPLWAPGMPVTAEGWAGPRLRK